MLFIAIAIISMLIILNLRVAMNLRAFVSGMRSQPAQIGKPLVPISVIIPCKGDDGRLLENLETLLSQDYSTAEFVLVTALQEDPAQSAFYRLRAAHPDLRIKTVVAGISPYGAEKNNNLLKAVAATDPGSEILVFLDSDGKSDGHLIRKLVSGLENSSVAAVSGFRWYEPRWHVLPEVLRTAWNAGAFYAFADPLTTFLWGGATALRRKTFQEAGIPDIWANSISDDSTLSVRLKEFGLKTQFLPNCIVLSSEQDGWRSLIQWINRQLFMARVHNKELYAVTFIWSVIGNFFGVGLLLWGLTRGFAGGGPAASFVGFLWIVHLCVVGWLNIDSIQQMLKASGIEPRLHKGLLIIVSPLLSLLEAFCSIYCIFVKRLKWAGVTYEVNGQTAKRL